MGRIMQTKDGSTLGGSVSANVYNATLKGKINGLEETCKALTEELNFYRCEISNLRDEKSDLAKKTADIRNGLANDVLNAEADMKKNYQSQKQENGKMQSAITVLKTEKTNLHQHLLDLKRRVAELELQIGD